jgi:hypothetical protein
MNICKFADYIRQIHGFIFGNKLLKKKSIFSFIEVLPQHKTDVWNRSDILDNGNRNIVLYHIKFMQAIHSPTTYNFIMNISSPQTPAQLLLITFSEKGICFKI